MRTEPARAAGPTEDEAPANELLIVQRAYAGAVVAAVFHPPEPFDQPLRDRLIANDADDAAHVLDS